MSSGDALVRLYGDLGYFCEVGDDGTTVVPIGTPRSVKDLIESLGVPHVEVGAILVDGEPADFGRLIRGGMRVTVFPPMHDLSPPLRVDEDPPEPRRFVADVHLGTLARRLRLLGFDTWYATDADDAALARLAVDETRILLTRDRGLLMRRVVVHGYCPRSSDPDVQLDEVVSRYELADRVRAFTRCAACNGPLGPVSKDEVAAELPARTRREHDEFARCSGCGQVYWPGSHVEALSGRFAELLSRHR